MPELPATLASCSHGRQICQVAGMAKRRHRDQIPATWPQRMPMPAGPTYCGCFRSHHRPSVTRNSAAAQAGTCKNGQLRVPDSEFRPDSIIMWDSIARFSADASDIRTGALHGTPVREYFVIRSPPRGTEVRAGNPAYRGSRLSRYLFWYVTCV